VLSLLRDAGVSLRLDKCHFSRRRVNYLGHVIEPGKLSVQATKVDTILKAKLPRTKTELRAFLGIYNVYRRFVPKFATIAATLTRHLRKDSLDSFELEESPDAVASLNSSDQCLRPLRHSRCQSKVLSMSWIPMLRKVSYHLASSSVMNMVFCIPLAIGRDNFHLRSVVITVGKSRSDTENTHKGQSQSNTED
jgi:hypothetical protein